MIDLSTHLSEKDLWKPEEVDSIRNWLDDLNLIGYKEPTMINMESLGSEYRCNQQITETHSKVRFTPKFQISLDSDTYCCQGRGVQSVYDRLESFNYLNEFCTKSNNFSIDHSIKPKHILSDPVY